MAGNADQPERPRVEPEIIPPGRGRQSDPDPWRAYESTWQRGAPRVYVTRLGPITTIILTLVFAALAAMLFVAILGAALLWLPLVALVVIVAAIYRYLLR